MSANFGHDIVEERDDNEALEKKVIYFLKPYCVIHKAIYCFSVLIF